MGFLEAGERNTAVTRGELEWVLRGARIQARQRYRRLPRGFGLEPEDLLVVAEAAVYEALTRFDPGRGVQFRTYAWTWVKGRLLREVRDWSPIPAHRQRALAHGAERRPYEYLAQSLDALPDYEEWMAEARDPGADEALRAVEAGAEGEAVWRAVASLSEPLREVVLLRFLEGLTVEETAARLGLSKQGVSKRWMQARAELRAALAEREEGGGG